MNHLVRKSAFSLALAGALWLCNGGVSPNHVRVVAEASAVVGAPVTPVSYAGVARRSTVGVGAPGVGATPVPGVGAPGVGATPAPGVGVGAPGVGATPAPGVNTPANVGGPVNRVGRR
jgi:hypothetical protein